jgi:hypothetical protein
MMVLDGLYLRMVCFHKRTSHFEMKMNGLFSQKKHLTLQCYFAKHACLHGLCIVDQNHFGIVFFNNG